MGAFARGTMAFEFEVVCFSAPLMQLQGPIKTRYGWHLILVTANEEAKKIN